MSYIEPTAEQIKELVEMDVKGPLVMLNLLKFKPEGGRILPGIRSWIQ